MNDLPDKVAPRLAFLFYARDDDELFVRWLHKDLLKAGFDVWFDRVSMPSRQLTFYQEIRDAIAARDRLVLVVGAKAVASAYVEQEWRSALEMGNPQQARCPMCGQEFAPPPAVVAAIQNHSAIRIPHSEILSSPCPHCQHPLQFNRFFAAAADYAKVLRRGLEQSRRDKGADHEETLAHLAALAAEERKKAE